MALPIRSQLIYWGIAALVFFFLLWWLGNIIVPFLLGVAVAYILDPVADRLETWGLSRVSAVSVMTVLGLIFVIAAFLLLIPTLISQSAQLAERIATIAESAPASLAQFQAWLAETYPGLVARFPQTGDLENTMRQSIGTAVEAIRSRAGTLVETAFASFASVFNILFLFLIVPVVSFYLLLDWDDIVARVDGLLPRDHAPTIRQLATDIDRTLASFVRGQALVCLILGIYYAAALAAVGLQFGLIVGAIAGFLTFIPFVGAIVGGALAIGLALFQFWGDWLWIIAVWAIFQSGQFVEGNFLTPKLVGSYIGLHPVWLLFALSAFGAVFGFVGLLVAVPVAAALGVLTRFAIAQYTASQLYRGVTERASREPLPGDTRRDTSRDAAE